MKTSMDYIEWENDFDIENLMNGPFAEIVALSKALDDSIIGR